MKKETKQKLIYLRYILPPVLIILVLLLGFLPSYRYVVGSEAHESVSLWSLIGDSWTLGRETLFAKSNATTGEQAFSKITLGFIIGSAILCGAALASAAWSCFVALKLFMSDDEESAEKSRTLFITAIPNRIALTVAEALVLPICLFPYLLPAIYAHTLGMNVRVDLAAPDCLIFAAVSLVAVAILSALCAPMERQFDADVFKRRKAFDRDESEEQSEVENYTSLFDTRGDETEEEKNQREAEAERIRRILRKDDENDKQN
jgi:hypothetical protein